MTIIKNHPNLARSALFAAITICVGLSTPLSLRAESNLASVANPAAIAGSALAKPLALRDSAILAVELAKYLDTKGGLNQPYGDPAGLMIEWLQTRLPGDEQAQAEVVGHFFGAIATTQFKNAQHLLMSLVGDLGVDYRRAVINALQAGNQPRRDLYSAMLAYRDLDNGDESANRATFKRYTAAALASDPNDPVTLLVAAQYEVGMFPDAATHLTQIAPDNLFHWLPLMRTKSLPDAHAALHEAAQRSAFDDYAGTLQLAYGDAIEASAVAVPALLAAAATALAPNDSAEASVARIEAYLAPLMRIAPLFQRCSPIGAPTVDATVHADCVKVGSLIARSAASGPARLLSAGIVQPLVKGTPLADEMAEVERLHRYLDAMEATLSLANRMSYPNRGFDIDVAKLGEYAARQRRLAHFGIPSEPPAGWEPGAIARPKSAVPGVAVAKRNAN